MATGQPSLDHPAMMQLAIDMARGNPLHPFGAVLVHQADQAVLAAGCNRAWEHPLMHGEIDAIDRLAKQGDNPVEWSRLTLYTTAEPCCMCQAAILWCHIPQVVFGTSIVTLRRLGWNQFHLTAQQVVDQAQFGRCELIGGVLEAECDALFEAAAKRRQDSMD